MQIFFYVIFKNLMLDIFFRKEQAHLIKCINPVMKRPFPPFISSLSLMKIVFSLQILYPLETLHLKLACLPGQITPSESLPGTKLVIQSPLTCGLCVQRPLMCLSRIRIMWKEGEPHQQTWSLVGR